MDEKLVELRDTSQEADEEAPDAGNDRVALVSDEFQQLEEARAAAQRRADAPVFATKPRRFRLGCLVATATIMLVVGLAIAFAIHHKDKTSASCQWSDYRLPTYFKPRSYVWSVRPQFAEPYKFNGTVTIDMDVITGGQECIVLSARDLDVTAGELSVEAGTAGLFVKHWWTTSEKDLLTVQLSTAPATGDRLSLTLAYSGALGRTLNGLYVSIFDDIDTGEPVSMVSTQFEATFARAAFPCFDEPAFKANFTVTVEDIPSGYVALGNMPVDTGATAAATSRAGVPSVAFQPSVPMSTYLVAIAVGPLESISGEVPAVRPGEHPIQVKVWSRRGLGGQLAYARDTAVSVLGFYQGLYGLPYPLPKCDLVAIPEFAAGAMENWGLVTYRETALLVDAANASIAQQQRVSVIIAHELAHQWFGNLVTMSWWSELFLNEGFASYMEYVGANHTNPQLHLFNNFLDNDWVNALRADAFAASHPLRRSDVDTPGEIEEQFDAISYAKGSSVISMVLHAVDRGAPGSFMRGVRAYLESHRFGNADAEQLWAAVQAASGEAELQARMRQYTVRAGFPLVTLAFQTETQAAAEAGQLVVTQRRFFHGPHSRALAVQEGEADTVWWVPLSYRTQASAQVQVVGDFTGAQAAATIAYDAAADGWIKANVGQTAYHRTLYPPSVYDRVVAYLSSAAAQEPGPASGHPFISDGRSSLSAVDRAGLLDDVWNVVRAQAAPAGSGVDAAKALTVLELARLEREHVVWALAASHLLGLDSALHPDSAADAAANSGDEACVAALWGRARGMLGNVVEELGWDMRAEDTPQTILLRSLVLSAASYFNHSAVVAQAQARFDAWRAGAALASDTEASVLRSGVRWGGSGAFDAVRAAYEAESDPTRKRTLLFALTRSRDKALLRSGLEYAMTGHVGTQDKAYFISSVAANPLGRELAWSFVKERVDDVIALYGNGGFALASLVQQVVSGFRTDAVLQDVDAFFQAHPLSAAAVEIAQAKETIAATRDFLQASRHTVCEWLEA